MPTIKVVIPATLQANPLVKIEEKGVRRNKSFVNTFPKDIVDWYESIPMTDLKQLQSIVDGDSTKGNTMKRELEKRAKEEGWILNPQGANPGSQEYKEIEDGKKQAAIS